MVLENVYCSTPRSSNNYSFSDSNWYNISPSSPRRDASSHQRVSSPHRNPLSHQRAYSPCRERSYSLRDESSYQRAYSPGRERSYSLYDESSRQTVSFLNMTNHLIILTCRNTSTSIFLHLDVTNLLSDILTHLVARLPHL